MNLLDEALERIKPSMIELLDSEENLRGGKDSMYRGDEHYGYFTGGTERGTVARLRLDWELNDKAAEGVPNEKIADMLLFQLSFDLSDLIDNGDVMNTSDSLLKSIDGSKKRGKEPVAIDIFRASMYWEYKEKKHSTEYTLFILMYVEWEGECSTSLTATTAVKR